MTDEIKVVGLGLATCDVLIRLKEMPTWEQGAPMANFRFEGGGPVGTAMAAAAKLGAKAGFIGMAGNDEVAGMKMQSLRESGVDLSRMVYHDAPEEQVVIVYVHAETGERVFSMPEGWGHHTLGVEDLDRDYITSADYLHLDGTHFTAALEAAKWMHEAGKTVMLDGHKADWPIENSTRVLIGHTDILISGSGFAKGLTGIDDIWEAGEEILKMGPRIFVQTEGKRGSFTVGRDDRFHMPAFEVDVVDTTGAGDVFHGAYLVGLLRGWDLRRITLFATAVSAIKCGKLGGRAGIPRFDAVMAFLRKRGLGFA